MTALADADLYRRGAETVLASWEEYARGATGAEVRRRRVSSSAMVELAAWNARLPARSRYGILCALR